MLKKKRVSSSQGAALCRRPGDGTSLCAASAQLLQLLRRHGHGALATAGHSSSRRNRSLLLLVGKSQTTLRSAFRCAWVLGNAVSTTNAARTGAKLSLSEASLDQPSRPRPPCKMDLV